MRHVAQVNTLLSWVCGGRPTRGNRHRTIANPGRRRGGAVCTWRDCTAAATGQILAPPPCQPVDVKCRRPGVRVGASPSPPHAPQRPSWWPRRLLPCPLEAPLGAGWTAPSASSSARSRCPPCASTGRCSRCASVGPLRSSSVPLLLHHCPPSPVPPPPPRRHVPPALPPSPDRRRPRVQ